MSVRHTRSRVVGPALLAALVLLSLLMPVRGDAPAAPAKTRGTPGVPPGIDATVGTNVEYARVHEFGFSGTVMVGGHVRQRFSSRSFIGATQANGKARTVRRKVRGADLAVGSHKRQMNIPARAPFFHGIQDRTEAIGTAVSRAAIKFMEGTP